MIFSDYGVRLAEFTLLAQISPEQGVKLVDALNSKNDRWLFIAMLVIFLLAIGWVVKWGSSQLEKRDAKLEAMGAEIGKVRDSHLQEISELRDKHEVQILQFAQQFATIVQDNTKAFLMFAQSMGNKPTEMGSVGSLRS